MTKNKSKPLYSDEHIDDLIDQLNVYEKAFRDEQGRLYGAYDLPDVICYNCSRCEQCIISNLPEEYSSCWKWDNARLWLTGWTGLYRISAIKWYHEMIRRANKNLEKSGNKWRIEPGKGIK